MIGDLEEYGCRAISACGWRIDIEADLIADGGN